MLRRKKGEKKCIVFYGVSPVKFVHFRPIFERLRQDSRLEIHLTGHLFRHGSAASLYELFDLPPGTSIIEEKEVRSLPGIDLWVSADYRLPKRLLGLTSPLRRSSKLQIFHGVSMKNAAIQENMKRFDKLCLVGPYMKRRFVESGLFPPGAPEFEELGMPKTDCLVNGAFKREGIFSQLDLKPDRPTILFAPTWMKKSRLMNSLGMALMKQFRSLDYNFLIKLHDSFFDPSKETVDWEDRLGKLKGERVRVIRDPDACPYLYVSDVLISDASSISNEFTLLDRPIIYMKVGSENLSRFLRRYRNADLETYGQRSGWVLSRPEEFESLLKRALENPDEHKEIRRKSAEDLFYNPGKATEAVVSFIERQLGLCP